jgi:hypothetical protein
LFLRILNYYWKWSGFSGRINKVKSTLWAAVRGIKARVWYQAIRSFTQGEKLNLMPYGNHARGAKFTDASHKVTQSWKILSMKCVYKFLDSFSEEWMWCTTLCRIRKWKNFFVVELNGAASEPTHIYDPKHSLFFAWKELARHITYMYEISVANNRMAYPT